ncbi:CcdB family protein, partial [Vreelandella aquamarina]
IWVPSMSYLLPLWRSYSGPAQGANSTPNVEEPSIEGQDFVIATQYMAAVPKGELRSCVGNLAEQQDEISAALDMLFLGFDARKS